ncbi:hypothetical protein QJS10_CPA09g00720 [Acorus calamus]|uniref:Uncharacterized protein n=1 Tax=Acorus calamus TaxID=4465 RepID=A0AAV9E5Z5_ACOCL|nr:hypothetical protein QJS10_CPA09g00720 [Acorus calamus]
MLQEITSIYHVLSPPTLTQEASNRVCNALSLLQVLEEWGVGEPVENLVGLRLGAYLQPNKGHDSLIHFMDNAHHADDLLEKRYEEKIGAH